LGNKKAGSAKVTDPAYLLKKSLSLKVLSLDLKFSTTFGSLHLRESHFFIQFLVGYSGLVSIHAFTRGCDMIALAYCLNQLLGLSIHYHKCCQIVRQFCFIFGSLFGSGALLYFGSLIGTWYSHVAWLSLRTWVFSAETDRSTVCGSLLCSGSLLKVDTIHFSGSLTTIGFLDMLAHSLPMMLLLWSGSFYSL
jgi:hypothetical protein